MAARTKSSRGTKPAPRSRVRRDARFPGATSHNTRTSPKSARRSASSTRTNSPRSWTKTPMRRSPSSPTSPARPTSDCADWRAPWPGESSSTSRDRVSPGVAASAGSPPNERRSPTATSTWTQVSMQLRPVVPHAGRSRRTTSPYAHGNGPTRRSVCSSIDPGRCTAIGWRRRPSLRRPSCTGTATTARSSRSPAPQWW